MYQMSDDIPGIWDYFMFKLFYFFTNIGEVSIVEKEMKKTLVETFKKTDEEFLKEATKMWVRIIYVCMHDLLLLNADRQDLHIGLWNNISFF